MYAIDYSTVNEFTNSNFCLINGIQEANSLIKHGSDFSHFDLCLDKNTDELLNNITATSNLDIDLCLNCDYSANHFEKIRTQIFENIGNMLETDTLINTVKSLASNTKFAIGNKNDYILLQLRLSLEGSNPNWHLDTLFKDLERRVVITLKGKATELYQTSNQFKHDLDTYQMCKFAPNYTLCSGGEDRPTWETEPYDQIDTTAISQAFHGQGSIFNNKEENAALHQTPYFTNSTRIFMIIDIVSANLFTLLNERIIDNKNPPHIINQTPSSYSL